VTQLFFVSLSLNVFYFLLCSLHDSAIGVAWLFITTSCIPVGFAHGLVTFANEEYEEETKCIFSAHEGYNHPIFQVSCYKNKTQKCTACLLSLAARVRKEIPNVCAQKEGNDLVLVKIHIN
jgi:hypothetical protein